MPSRTGRLLLGKTNLGEIVAILQAEVEFALGELVEINAGMFRVENQQYLAGLTKPKGNGAEE
jgi:hypothetical protein